MTKKWRALAWDDDPAAFLETLKPRLENTGRIEVTITSEVDECYREFLDKGPWDFLILDVVDETSDPENPEVHAGTRLAQQLRSLNVGIPIVFLTLRESIVLRGGVVIDDPKLVKSKGTPIGGLVNDILEFLKEELFDRTKVFLIYGHGQEAEGLLGKVRQALAAHQVDVAEISPESVMTTISEDLVRQMAECGAFVALCTPDDEVRDNLFQPRQNVLLELGIAMGLRRGFSRLVVLQRWGESPKHQALLPSDLGGALPIRFYEEQDAAVRTMITALERRGIRVLRKDAAGR